MAKSFQTPIDMNGLEVRNFLAHILSSDPGSPIEGQIWYNSTAHILRYRTNTTTLDLDPTKLNGQAASYYLARANHTGTQLASTISDFTTAVQAVSLSGDITGTIGATAIGTGVIVNTDISASAAIALSKLATDPLARANHTGTQTASTISDLATVVQAYRLDQFAAPTTSVSLNSQKITNLLDPTNPQDASTKAYVDATAQGLSVKDPVRVVTTTNIATLAGGAPNSYDGVTLAANDRILVAGQTTASQNGIYTITTLGTGANGTWTRATDMDTSAETKPGSIMWVNEGTANGDTQWILTTNAPITLATTSLTFTKFAGGTSYSADGTTLTLTGSVFSINTGYVGQTSITTLGTIATGTWSATTIAANKGGTGQTTYAVGDILYASSTSALSKLTVGTGSQVLIGGTTPSWAQVNLTSMVTGTLPVANGGTGGNSTANAKSSLGFMTRFAQDIGDGSSTSIAVTHSLGTLDVVVAVYLKSSGADVECDVVRTSTSVVTLGFATAPATNAYHVVVIG